MAEQRGGGEVRNNKILNTTDNDEKFQEIDNTSHDAWGGLFTAEYFKQLDTSAPVDLNVDAFDVHGGENFSANASGGETVNGSCTQEDAQMIVDFLESVAGHDDDGGIEMVKEVLTFTPSLDDLLSDLKFENPDFGSGGGEKIEGDVKSEDMNGSDGFVGQRNRMRKRTSSHGFNVYSQGIAQRRIRMQLRRCVGEDFESKEFGRDTNRLDYFSVTPFHVPGDDHLTGVGRYGGGGGRRDRGIVLAPRLEQERGGANDVAGGGNGIERVPVGISDNNGGEAVVQRLEQERGDDGGGGSRRGRRLMVGRRLEQERGSTTARAGGGDRTREVPGGIFANNGSDDGEVLIKRLKQEGATVAVPVVVVQAVALMMMVMVMVIVVVSVMLKTEVWW